MQNSVDVQVDWNISAIKEQHSKYKLLLHFIRYELIQDVLMGHWLLILLLMIIIIPLWINHALPPTNLTGATANVWDGLFIMFSNPYAIAYVLTPLFLFFTNTLSSELTSDELVLLRLGSRRLWWFGKVITLAVITIVYMVTMVITAAAIISFAYPWEVGWSKLAQSDAATIYLEPTALKSAPLVVLALATLILGLGWYSFGLAALVCSQWLQNSKAGFSVGFALNLSIIFFIHIYLPPPLRWLTINTHLFISEQSFNDIPTLHVNILISCAYWFAWIAILIVVGLWVCQNCDIVHRTRPK